MSTRPAAPRRVLPGSPFNVPPAPAGPLEHFAVGDLLTHDRHGVGTVVGVQDELVLLVDFKTSKQRISLPNPKVTKL